MLLVCCNDVLRWDALARISSTRSQLQVQEVVVVIVVVSHLSTESVVAAVSVDRRRQGVRQQPVASQQLELRGQRRRCRSSHRRRCVSSPSSSRASWMVVRGRGPQRWTRIPKLIGMNMNPRTFTFRVRTAPSSGPPPQPELISVLS